MDRFPRRYREGQEEIRPLTSPKIQRSWIARSGAHRSETVVQVACTMSDVRLASIAEMTMRRLPWRPSYGAGLALWRFQIRNFRLPRSAPWHIDPMEKQDFKSPLPKTMQVLVVAISAFVLGLYVVKFSGSGWDWGNVVGCLGAVVFCTLFLFILIRGSWMPNA